MPKHVSTLEDFRGKKSPYVLLSLVRTSEVGKIRHFRNQITAFASGTHGIYIFGRLVLFEACNELKHPVSVLLKRPTKLAILPNERFDNMQRKSQNDVKTAIEINDLVEMGKIAYETVI